MSAPEDVPHVAPSLAAIVGVSPLVEALRDDVARAAPSAVPALVTGESGTGKDLVARALHEASGRPGAFVAVNCAAIPATLFEAELFGHARGAFTGAGDERVGVFESADDGTLFLDELGELPMAMQAKLLRLIDTGAVLRLGATAPRKVRVRVVAATNRELAREVAVGRFREDLYYRVRVLHLAVPPLRARIEDVPSLATHALARIASRDGNERCHLTRAALAKLVQHAWPGNVRELFGCLERAVLNAGAGAAIEAEHVDVGGGGATPLLPFDVARARFEARYWTKVLRVAEGNVSFAAKLAGRGRAQVYEALRRLGIDPEEYRVRR